MKSSFPPPPNKKVEDKEMEKLKTKMTKLFQVKASSRSLGINNRCSFKKRCRFHVPCLPKILGPQKISKKAIIIGHWFPFVIKKKREVVITKGFWSKDVEEGFCLKWRGPHATRSQSTPELPSNEAVLG